MRRLALGLILGAVLMALAQPLLGQSHRPGRHSQQLETPLIHWLAFVRGEVDEVRDARCLPALRRRWTLYEVPVGMRRYVIRQELERRRMAGEAGSRCLPTSPSGIIRYVFPDATEDAAIRVAYCESRLDPNADNPTSSAAGLFQLLSTWYAGKFNPYEPWANTRFAYQLSDAGYNWSHWAASGGCHGL